MFNWFKQQENRPKTLGQQGELLAQEEYKKRGYNIVVANFFNKKGLRLGEIDFIASNNSEIIFVEVKTRSKQTSSFGTAADSVNQLKQIKILKAVKTFLVKNPEFTKLKPQIDVCVVIGNPLDKNAVNVTILSNAVEDWN